MQRYFLVFFVLLGLGSVCFADSVLVGTHAPNSGNCIPAPCSYYDPTQQVYSSGIFSAPVTINAISFFAYEGGETFNNYGLNVYASTTSASVNGLSSNLNSNLGADNTLVWSGTLNGSYGAGSAVTLGGLNFNYDPSLGNLLFTFYYTGGNGGGGFEFNYNNGLFSRAYNGAVTGADNGGVVTEFDFNNPTNQTPEPGSLVLLGSALFGMAGAIRRKLVA